MNKPEESSDPERPILLEEEKVQGQLNQIFTRCGRLIEQAEIVFPKNRLPSDTDEERKRNFSSAKTPMPHYVFIFPNGRENSIEADRTKEVEGRLQRADEFWQMHYTFNLSLLDRLSLGFNLPKTVVLDMEKLEDGTIKANIKDFLPKAISKTLTNQEPRSYDVNRLPAVKALKVLGKCVTMLSESPTKVTDYARQDLKNFSSLQA